jgi:hypothetical protein
VASAADTDPHRRSEQSGTTRHTNGKLMHQLDLPAPPPLADGGLRIFALDGL